MRVPRAKLHLRQPQLRAAYLLAKHWNAAAARAEEGARGLAEPPPPDAATQRLYIR